MGELRQLGNKLFGEQKYQNAVDKYQKVLSFSFLLIFMNRSYAILFISMRKLQAMKKKLRLEKLRFPVIQTVLPVISN